MLNNLPGVTSVHGRFYDLSSKYYRIIGNHAAYYKDALRYLGCVDIKDLHGGLRHDGKRRCAVMCGRLQRRAELCCWLHRDREAGEGVHIGTGRTPRGGSLQLRRAGGCLTATVSVCRQSWLKPDRICRCVCSWCILCWSPWGTRTNSGSLIRCTPSTEATSKNSRASGLPGANRWLIHLRSIHLPQTDHIYREQHTTRVLLIRHQDPADDHLCFSLFVAWSCDTWS